jgi:hypothetical protein
MKLYLAAQFSRREEIQAYAKSLIDLGYEVTSRWLFGTHGTVDTNKTKDAPLHPDPNRVLCAAEDEVDIDRADIFVQFTELPYYGYPGTGGRHYEMGYARGHNKQLYFVGPYENVFHDLHGSYGNFAPDFTGLLKILPK